MTITKAEHDRLMETRTRPLTDPCMDNGKASRWRAEQVERYEPVTATGRTMPTPRSGMSDGCGTAAGYHSHRQRREIPCDGCKLAWSNRCAENREARRAS